VPVDRTDGGAVSRSLPQLLDVKALRAELAANRERREAAAVETEAAREVLRALLVRGRALGAPIAAMARAAGISRETAHKLLREEPPSKSARRTDG
jgi:hypothetical protein